MLMEFAVQAMPLHQEIISPHNLSADVSNATGSSSSSQDACSQNLISDIRSNNNL
jgi:hypothetical protein